MSGWLTLVFGWLAFATASGTTCGKGSPFTALPMLMFLGLAGLAGWLTVKAGGSVRRAAVAGFVVAAISAVGTVVAVPIEIATLANRCLAGNPASNAFSWAIVGGLLLFVTALMSVFGLGIGALAGTVGGLIANQQRPAPTSADR